MTFRGIQDLQDHQEGQRICLSLEWGQITPVPVHCAHRAKRGKASL